MTDMQTSIVVLFKHICNFVKDVHSSFGSKCHPLTLYAHIIEQTGIMHEEPIRRHIQAFYTFVKDNESAILEKEVGLLQNPVIQYSDKVYIDMKEIFGYADEDDQGILWKHLMNLLAILDPSSEAKRILSQEEKAKQKNGETANEEKFLNDMVHKVGEFVRPDSNPNDMVQNILNSGMVNDLVNNMTTGLNEGDLDMNKMMSTVQKMMTTLGTMMNSMSS
jgi:hypothetical protein